MPCPISSPSVKHACGLNWTKLPELRSLRYVLRCQASSDVSFAQLLTSLVVYRFNHLLASAAWPPRRLLPHLRCHSYMAARKLSKSGRNAKASIFKDQSINCGSAIGTLVWATKVRTVDLQQLIAVLRPPQDCFNPSCTIPVWEATYTLKFQRWFLGRLANFASCSHGIAVNCNQGITQGLPNSSGTFTYQAKESYGVESSKA